MIVRPFQHTDLYLLDVQPMQEVELALLSPAARRMLEQKSDPAVSLVADGSLLACTGIVPIVASRAILWAFIARGAGRYMTAVTRFAKRFVAESGYDRVETTVRADFPAGVRFAEMAGFINETPNGMQKYGPNGAEYLYARVR